VLLKTKKWAALVGSVLQAQKTGLKKGIVCLLDECCDCVYGAAVA